MQAEVGQQQSKPGLGQRARAEGRFSDGMPEGHGMYQQMAAAKAGEEEAVFSTLLADIRAAGIHRLSTALKHLPEDIVGELHRPIGINPDDFMDALRKSQ